MSPHRPEEPAIPSLPNLRDLGGRTTRDGRQVRTGLAFRSTDLGALEGADADAFARLGVRTVCDLRTEGERTALPDRIPSGTGYLVVDVLGDSPRTSPAKLFESLADPRTAEVALGGGRGAAFFLGAYRGFVHMRSARAAYGRLFLELAQLERRPVLFHCSTGKDRTGWAAAALLLLLGVPEEAVMEDYLLSAQRLGPKVRPLLDQFRARGGDPALLEPFTSVRAEYLEAAFDELRRLHGTVERYFADGLGVDAAVQAALRAAFLTG